MSDSPNTKYLPVSAVTAYLKAKYDNDPYLARIPITGEISNFSLRPNGHQYFSIKDSGAKINVVIFKNVFSKIKFDLEEGMKVNIIGRVSIFESSGQYQIYVEQIEPSGVGELHQAYEQLIKKLDNENLFDIKRKKPIPRIPERIAVITSPTGAVVRDIITTVQRRYPLTDIIIFPTQVQGSEAADSLVRQVQRADQSGIFDTMIIARGGGSIEDLWPFNNETLARTIAGVKTPVISSIGHETDTTLVDLVSDLRAATPTAAAELATPDVDSVNQEIDAYKILLANFTQQKIINLDVSLQRLSDSYFFQQPQRLTRSFTQRIENLRTRLASTMNVKLSSSKEQFAVAVSQLDAISPLGVLSRGYSYVTDQDNKPVKSVKNVNIRDLLNIRMHDGTLRVNVINKGEKKNGK